MGPKDSYRYRFRVPEFTARHFKIKSTEKREPNKKVEYIGGILGLAWLVIVIMFFGLQSGILGSCISSIIFALAHYWSRRDRESLIVTAVFSAPSYSCML